MVLRLPRSTRTDTLVPDPTPSHTRRAPAGLNDRIYDLWRTFPGKTGIAVQRSDGGWKLSQRGDELFPQQSVSKLWVTLTVLDAIDQGRLTFDQLVLIGPEDLALFYQTLAALLRADGSVTMCVRDLIENATSRSANTENDSPRLTVSAHDAARATHAK